MKKTISFMLIISLLLCLCACDKEGSSSEVTYLPIENDEPFGELPGSTGSALSDQLRLIEQNSSLWLVNSEYEPYYYAVTDFDANGRLEIISASTQGTGVFTYGSIYEVSPEFDGLVSCLESADGENVLPEIIVSTADAYIAQDGTHYYIFTDNAKTGAAEYYAATVALSLFGGRATLMTVASMHTVYNGDTPTTTYADSLGNPIDESAYNSAVQSLFVGTERKTAAFGWFAAEQSQLGSLLERSLNTFTLTAPAVVETTPAPTPVPAPTATPAPQSLPQAPVVTPTPAPAAKPASGGSITITKNPTSESLAIGGKTWFIAYADKATAITWQLLDTNGKVYSLSEAITANPGLKLEPLEGDTLAVSNVPQSLNGWSVQAVFSNASGSAATSPAYIYVGDFVNDYASVIEKYKKAYTASGINSGTAESAGISEMAAYSEHVGYAMKDLDKDGTPELIIGGTGENNNAGNIIYEICTLGNGQPKTLCRSSSRDRFYLRTDSSILNVASSGAAYTYYTVSKLNKGALSTLEYLHSDLDDNAVAVWLYTNSSNGGTEKQISADQAQTLINGYEKAEYVPFFTKIV